MGSSRVHPLHALPRVGTMSCPEPGGGKAIKTQRRKTLRRNAAKAARRRSPATAKETNVAQAIRERDDALEQLTATAEVLTVMSRSAFELQTVFDALVKSATRLCHASASVIWRPKDDGRYHLAASYGVERRFEEQLKGLALKPDGHSVVGRSLQSDKTTYVSDLMADPDYASRDVNDFGGYRDLLCVPLLRDGVAIGVLMVAHLTSSKFDEKQIMLVNSFAKQAVIAIENTRLLNELRESLQQQTATADVLRIISASLGELEPVFNAILQNATRICEARFGTLYRFDGLAFYQAAGHGTPDALIEAQKKQGHFVPEPGTLMHRVMHTRAAAHSADYAAESALGLSAKFGGARSTVVVPMLKDSELVGAFAIYRQEVRPFTEKQISLLENFAAQAVIAIENARLLNELRQRTHELSASLDNLRATQNRLVQTEKLASLGQLTAGIAHEIKNPLNFVNNFSGVSTELIGELQNTLSGLSVDPVAQAELKELTDTLRGNLEKVVLHGRRADAIVKSMLLHSGESSGQLQSTDINALVEESLNRAYYNARAEQRGFTIKLEKSFDPAAGEADLFPREITRALLNLISNAFYAATKRKAANEGDHEPTLTAATKNLGDRVEIRIRDNGTGIAADVKEKMFNPFFTTKPTGEGTGLGLSITHDIIVKQHGGSIEVDTKPGEFAEIRVILPRATSFV
jgi:signal transduction histidine kinase